MGCFYIWNCLHFLVFVLFGVDFIYDVISLFWFILFFWGQLEFWCCLHSLGHFHFWGHLHYLEYFHFSLYLILLNSSIFSIQRNTKKYCQKSMGTIRHSLALLYYVWQCSMRWLLSNQKLSHTHKQKIKILLGPVLRAAYAKIQFTPYDLVSFKQLNKFFIDGSILCNQ